MVIFWTINDGVQRMFVFLPKSVSSPEQEKEPGTKAQNQESYNAYQIIIVPKNGLKILT